MFLHADLTNVVKNKNFADNKHRLLKNERNDNAISVYREKFNHFIEVDEFIRTMVADYETPIKYEI